MEEKTTLKKKKNAQLASALALTVTWTLNDKELAEYTFDDETFRTTPFNFVEILNAATSPRICHTCFFEVVEVRAGAIVKAVCPVQCPA